MTFERSRSGKWSENANRKHRKRELPRRFDPSPPLPPFFSFFFSAIVPTAGIIESLSPRARSFTGAEIPPKFHNAGRDAARRIAVLRNIKFLRVYSVLSLSLSLSLASSWIVMTDDARVLKAATEAAFLLLRAHSRARAFLVVSASPRGGGITPTGYQTTLAYLCIQLFAGAPSIRNRACLLVAGVFHKYLAILIFLFPRSSSASSPFPLPAPFIDSGSRDPTRAGGIRKRFRENAHRASLLRSSLEAPRDYRNVDRDAPRFEKDVDTRTFAFAVANFLNTSNARVSVSVKQPFSHSRGSAASFPVTLSNIKIANPEARRLSWQRRENPPRDQKRPLCPSGAVVLVESKFHVHRGFSRRINSLKSGAKTTRGIHDEDLRVSLCAYSMLAWMHPRDLHEASRRATRCASVNSR